MPDETDEIVQGDDSCPICESKKGEPHKMRRHDAWEDANDATWD